MLAELANFMQQADKTTDLVAAVQELARPSAAAAASGIDPELKEWMTLRPNLPEDQQTVIDSLAADAIKKLQARLRPAVSTDDQGGGGGDSDRAFSGNFSG